MCDAGLDASKTTLGRPAGSSDGYVEPPCSGAIYLQNSIAGEQEQEEVCFFFQGSSRALGFRMENWNTYGKGCSLVCVQDAATKYYFFPLDQENSLCLLSSVLKIGPGSCFCC